MAGRKRKAVGEPSTAATASASPRATRTTRSRTTQNDIPDVYRDMLIEANVQSIGTADQPPAKRKRPGQRSERLAQRLKPPIVKNDHETSVRVEEQNDEGEDEELDDIQFEDVALPTATIQTVYRDSDDEDEEEEDDMVFEDVDFSAHATVDSDLDTSKDLELDLSSRTKSTVAKSADRRKPINKAEKERRIEIHKLHLLCLLAHVARRNRWCNDAQVQDSLRPLLSQKMVKLLNPDSHLTQFGQANSMKEGLTMVNNMFVTKYQITERGIRRALWAETEEQLQNVLFLAVLYTKKRLIIACSMICPTIRKHL